MRPPSGEILQDDYQRRINRVMDYIHGQCGEDMNLGMLAEMACLSKFHFHRIFKSLVGETVGDYIRRVRMQEAFLKLGCYPHKSLTEIALEGGFSSSQNFTRMFKALRGKTPSTLRQSLNWQNFLKARQGLKEKSKEAFSPEEAYFYDLFCRKMQMPLKKMLNDPPLQNVQIRQMPDLHVAYMRSIGPTGEEIPDNFRRLLQWAIPRGHLKEGLMVLLVIRNYLGIVSENKIILDACFTVSEFVKADNWVSVQTIPGGLYAVHHCEVASADDYDEMWLRFMFNWLTDSDFALDVLPARPHYQRYCEAVESHPLKHHVLDLYLPIKPIYG